MDENQLDVRLWMDHIRMGEERITQMRATAMIFDLADGFLVSCVLLLALIVAEGLWR